MSRRPNGPRTDVSCAYPYCDQTPEYGTGKGEAARSWCPAHVPSPVAPAPVQSWDEVYGVPDGTKTLDDDGYVSVYVKGRGTVKEHTLVMEVMLGRRLHRGVESVHHKNGHRDDNHPDNLELWVTSQRYGQRATDICCGSCGARWENARVSSPYGR